MGFNDDPFLIAGKPKVTSFGEIIYQLVIMKMSAYLRKERKCIMEDGEAVLQFETERNLHVACHYT